MLKKEFEKLAEIQHDIWSDLMRHIFRNCITNFDESVLIPKETVRRWKRQMRTAYRDLSKEEKDSDRRIASRQITRRNNAKKAMCELCGDCGHYGRLPDKVWRCAKGYHPAGLGSSPPECTDWTPTYLTCNDCSAYTEAGRCISMDRTQPVECGPEIPDDCPAVWARTEF